jgi:hypothetical protein
MSKEFGSWDDGFPKVMHFIDHQNTYAKPWNILLAHPDYDAAKNHEDRAAAARLVKRMLNTPENQDLLRTLKKQYPDAAIVPIRAIETNGKNRIPEMLAEYIAHQTGLEVDTGIVQTNKVHRTQSDAWHRFAFRPTFDGEVRIGGKYILVDDVFSNGGSFNELRLHIERNGGKVAQTVVMSLGGHGDAIAPKPEERKMLLDKFGKEKLQSFLKEIGLYEGNYQCLTGPETAALRRTPSLDQARDRVLAARCRGRARNSEETVCRCEAPQLKKPPRRSLHR